jgi:peptide/nickel transport system permease protein
MLSRKTYKTKASPFFLAWSRFRKNVVAMAGLAWIILSVIAATLGYLITPDSTPFANHQQLELAAHPPSTSVKMLEVKKNTTVVSRGIFATMLYGRPAEHTTIPLHSYWFEDHYLYFETYSGDPDFPGQEGRYEIHDVLFAVDRSMPFMVIYEKISFYHISGQQMEFEIRQLQQKLVENNIFHKRFILGTDRFGRDILSQLIIGTRVSLSVGFIAVFISLVIGLTLGCLAGYFRGRLDDLIVWLINVIWSVPTLLLVIAITFAIGKGFWQVFLAVGLTMWVEVARIARGQVISLREKEFVESARALGLTNLRIISRHILPNIMGPVIVISAANFASAILIEAGLSFLGIGVQPPMPSWGTMIREHYGFIILDKGFLAFLPGLMIMLMVLAFMLAGNGLRDAFDRTPD